MTDQSDILSRMTRRIEIPINRHLHAGGPKMPLDYPFELRRMRELGIAKGLKDADESNLLGNLARISENQIRAIATRFGEEGIFKLILLATPLDKSEFEHFFQFITSDMALETVRRESPALPLEPDNAVLRAGPELNGFNHNVINTSLSRKLYNPGRKEGYLVYGMGGPRILVSLPFVGASKYTYDVYNNSLDVVTSLTARSFHGSFLLLDSIEGLNTMLFGQPSWLLWFSIIAVHSDLIIFVKEKGKDFSNAQKLEIAFTPDRVAKKIVELNEGELSWAKADGVDPSTEMLHVLPGKGVVSAEEWAKSQLANNVPFIEMYKRDVFPDDRLIVIHEEGSISEHPLA